MASLQERTEKHMELTKTINWMLTALPVVFSPARQVSFPVPIPIESDSSEGMRGRSQSGECWIANIWMKKTEWLPETDIERLSG